LEEVVIRKSVPQWISYHHEFVWFFHILYLFFLREKADSGLLLNPISTGAWGPLVGVNVVHRWLPIGRAGQRYLSIMHAAIKACLDSAGPSGTCPSRAPPSPEALSEAARFPAGKERRRATFFHRCHCLTHLSQPSLLTLSIFPAHVIVAVPDPRHRSSHRHLLLPLRPPENS
jgi:hypothetical protein